MQTSPILSQANALSNSTSACKPSGDSTSGTSFNQMLSREIADRHHAEAPKAPESGKAPAPADQTAPATATSATSRPQDKKTASDEKQEDSKDATSGATVDATAPTPADMLALVANVQQSQGTQKTIDAHSAGDEKAAKAVSKETLALAATDAKPQGAADMPLDAVSAAPRSEKTDLKAENALTAVDAKNHPQTQAKTQKPEPGTAIAEKPVTTNAAMKPAADLAAKEPAAAASTSAKPDFAAQIKESLANASTVMQPVQQAVLHAAQPAVVPVREKLAPAVGTPAWDQALGQKVVWMVAGEHQSASLTLNPPDLGPLQVVLNVTNSTASATFTAAQPEVRQALEAALPRLRDMLGDAGIQLGQATVNSGASSQHQGTADQQTPFGGRSGETADNRSEAPMRVSRVQPAASRQGLVDTFA